VSFCAIDSYCVILYLECIASGQVEEHGSAVTQAVHLFRCPLSASEASDTLIVVLNFEESDSRSLVITHSVEVCCHPTVSGAFVSDDSPELVITHDLLKVCLLFGINCAIRLIQDWFFLNNWRRYHNFLSADCNIRRD
jgi:hypothetical protein